jgi:Mitochondrial carrier protein
MAGDLAHNEMRRGALIRCFSTILRSEGIRGLYKGIGATLTQVTPALAINFTAYELSKSYVAAMLHRHSGHGRGLLWTDSGQCSHSGAESAHVKTGELRPYAAMQSPVARAENAQRNPATLALASGERMAELSSQSDARVSSSLVFTAAASSDGSSCNLPSSASSSCTNGRAGRAPAAAASTSEASQLSVYERALVSLIAGTVSGVVSSTSTFPLDVVRRRLQVAPSNTSYMSVCSSLGGKLPCLALTLALVSCASDHVTGHLVLHSTYFAGQQCRLLMRACWCRWCDICTMMVVSGLSIRVCYQNISR